MPLDYDSIAARYGLPPDVLRALIQQESGGNPLAVGDNGASVGLGQFNVRGALADLGLTRDQVLAMPAEQQADLTAKFLATKVQQAGGDLWGGVKRYNGGGDPNYVQNVQRRLPGGVDVRQAALGPQPGTMSTDTAPETPSGDPVTGRMNPPAYPNTLEDAAQVYQAQQEMQAIRERLHQAGQATAPFGLGDMLAIAASMAAGGGNPLSALGDWATARASVGEAEFKQKQRAALEVGQAAKVEETLAALEERVARKRWLSDLTQAERQMVAAGYGDEVAKAKMKSPDAPSGYAWTPDRKTLEPIPGGPAAQRPPPPSGYAWTQGNTLVPIPGGPAVQPPSGYTRSATGLVPIPGGPADPTLPAYGPLKPGEVRMGDKVVDVPGGASEAAKLKTAKHLGSALNRLQQLEDLVDKHGTEAFTWPVVGDTTRGDMSGVYGGIITDMAEINNQGVINVGDLEFNRSVLTDPSQVGAMFTSTAMMKGQMKAYRERLEEKAREAGLTPDRGKIKGKEVPPPPEGAHIIP